MPPRRRVLFGVDDELFTPITDEVRKIFDRMVAACGSKANFYEVVWMSPKSLRRLYRQHSSISMSLMDRMMTTTGVGLLQDLPWHTAEEMEELGYWRQPLPIISVPRKERPAVRRELIRRRLAINEEARLRRRIEEAKAAARPPRAPANWRIPTDPPGNPNWREAKLRRERRQAG